MSNPNDPCKILIYLWKWSKYSKFVTCTILNQILIKTSSNLPINPFKSQPQLLQSSNLISTFTEILFHQTNKSQFMVINNIYHSHTIFNQLFLYLNSSSFTNQKTPKLNHIYTENIQDSNYKKTFEKTNLYILFGIKQKFAMMRLRIKLII